MTRKRIAVIIAALAIVAGAGLAMNEFAGAGGWGPGGPPTFFGGGPGFGSHMGFGGVPIIPQALALRKELKLNEDQVKKL